MKKDTGFSFLDATKDTPILFEPLWADWLNLASVSLAEAAALSINREPRPDAPDRLEEVLNTNPDLEEDFPLARSVVFRQELEIQKRLDVALNHARAGTLPCSRNADGNFFVTLGNFRAWGESLPTPFTFPPEYPAATPKDATQKGVTQEKSGKLTKGNGKLFWTQDSIEPEENEEDAMRSNQREKLYCIIAALEKAASLTAKTLHERMKRDGVDVSERTIGRAFKEAKRVYKEKKT